MVYTGMSSASLDFARTVQGAVNIHTYNVHVLYVTISFVKVVSDRNVSVYYSTACTSVPL